jgi:lantibiotic modifying enzyme
LAEKLEELLAFQLPDGNWPTIAEKTESKLVQWCHGAPGFVLCLLSLRPFFPTLHEKIDAAIERGRACTWEKGLLKKEPSLCHGILSNAL